MREGQQSTMSVRQVIGSGVGEAIRQAIPPWLIPVFIGITRLGNVVLFFGLFTLDYWFGDHERGAHAISLALGGMALITILKALFAEPRPPEAVRVITTGGYSLPSGHAATATIGWGLLAYDLKTGSPYTRYAVAAILIILVALSRVVLGVHFVRDVIAGIFVGIAFLVVTSLLTEHAPRPGFLLAASLGVVALLISGASQDSVAELGAILGASIAWESLGEEIPSVGTTREHLALVATLPGFGILGYLSLATQINLILVFLLNVVLLAGIIVAPLVVTKFSEWRLARQSTP